ncbi:MAG: hypothetical protein NZ551_11060 [Microscillaceae bacterium]|nr:hypothetical protein [Microscillaceae bacterium]MDW8461736.1 hypothetical protein [Cytophagales bacterium]
MGVPFALFAIAQRAKGRALQGFANASVLHYISHQALTGLPLQSLTHEKKLPQSSELLERFYSWHE